MSFIFRSSEPSVDVVRSYVNVSNAVAQCLLKNGGKPKLSAEQLNTIAAAVRQLQEDAVKVGPEAQVLVEAAQQFHTQLATESVDPAMVLDRFERIGKLFAGTER